MRPLCEIIYVESAKGWKWRALREDEKQVQAKPCDETYDLFYDCVTAARARGFAANIRCL